MCGTKIGRKFNHARERETDSPSFLVFGSEKKKVYGEKMLTVRFYHGNKQKKKKRMWELVHLFSYLAFLLLLYA